MKQKGNQYNKTDGPASGLVVYSARYEAIFDLDRVCLVRPKDSRAIITETINHVDVDL